MFEGRVFLIYFELTPCKMMSRFFSKERSRHSSSVQNAKEFTVNEYLDQGFNSNDIDVLAKMHEGTKLLKLCSRRTRSHWRTFVLDPDNESISWISHKKEKMDTTIHISNIREIVCHSANVVSKFMDTLPDDMKDTKELDLRRMQFTIKYLDHNNNNKHSYPSISPHVSITNREMISPKDPCIPSVISPVTSQSTRSDHNSKTSLSFIRAVPTNNASSRNTNNKDTKYLEDSVTDSGSSSSKKRGGRERSASKSFFKNLLKSSNDKTTELDPALTPDGYRAHSRNVTADSMNLSRNGTSNANNEYKGKHIQELHVMAKNPVETMIWVYGLEQLVDIHRNDKGLPEQQGPLFTISTKELLRYGEDRQSTIRSERMTMRMRPHLEEENFNEFKVLQDQRHRLQDGLHRIIDQLPDPEQKALEEDKEIEHETTLICLVRKIRQDQESLRSIFADDEFVRVRTPHDIKVNIKRWSFILTRIEINIGGYQIALNNHTNHPQRAKHKRSITHYNPSPITWNQSRSETLGDRLGHNTHKRHRARRQSNHSPKQLHMLKNRSRSPRSTNVSIEPMGSNGLPQSLHLPSPHHLTKAEST